jgi:hypothetical protein
VDPQAPTLPPGDLVAALASTSIAERDEATRVAIAMGIGVAPRLLQWDAGSPPAAKARRLWTFIGIHLRYGDELLRGAPAIASYRHTGTLGSALAALAAKRGVVAVENLDGAHVPAALELADAATTLRVFDELCRQANVTGAFARGEFSTRNAPQPPYPVAYRGPLRVRVVEVRSTRVTDFVIAHATVQARLRVDWEWPISPSYGIVATIDGARRVDPAVAVDGGSDEIVAELTPSNNAIAVSGTITGAFSTGYDEVRLPVPGTVERDGLLVTAGVVDGSTQIVLEAQTPARYRADAGVLGVSSLVLAITAAGEEAAPGIHRVRSIGTRAIERWSLHPRADLAPITELRLRIAAVPARHAFGFAIPPFVP